MAARTVPTGSRFMTISGRQPKCARIEAAHKGMQHGLTRHAHDPDELSAAAIASFSKDTKHWSEKQIRALLSLRQRMPILERLLMAEYRSIPDEEELQLLVPVMQCFITLLSDIFFLGALQGIVFKWDPKLNLIGRSLYDSRSGQNEIAIDPVRCFKERHPALRIVSILLHESSHTLISMYSYRRQPNCALGQHHISHCASLGHSGHGGAWTELVSHIEARAKLEIGHRIMVGMMDGLGTELRTSGQIPSASSIARCHQDAREVLTKRNKMIKRGATIVFGVVRQFPKDDVKPALWKFSRFRTPVVEEEPAAMPRKPVISKGILRWIPKGKVESGVLKPFIMNGELRWVSEGRLAELRH